MLKQIGFNAEVVYFERDYHSGRVPDTKSTSLGRIEHGKYAARIIVFFKSILKLRQMIKDYDMVYCSGPDMAYLSILSSIGLKTPTVMEVGDLREIQLRVGIVGKSVRFLEKLFLGKCAFVVSTSEGFIEAYYRKIKPDLNYLILENKLEKGALPQSESINLESEKITIGYFGVLRCNWSWQVLCALAERNPNRFQIFVAGYNLSIDNFEEEIEKHDNIEYYGTYKSPDELHTIYGQVDLIWGVYPVPTSESEQNWKWAKTNRFYESLYYQRPMIVLKDSGDAKAVKILQSGLAISKDKIDDAVSLLEKIEKEEVYHLQKFTREVPMSTYIYEKEYEQLREKILKHAKKP
jgi:succinoglycan biosynthesis protein ExoL